MDAKIGRAELLARHTTFRIGGPAEYFVRVDSRDELIQAVEWARTQHLEIFILGNGSNILVSDAGVRGLVIENHADKVVERESEQRTFGRESAENRERLLVTAESGASLPGLANRLAREGWRGLEWAIGIPGTVGAAVVTNAGAHGGAVSDCLVRAEILGVRADESAATQREADLRRLENGNSRGLENGNSRGLENGNSRGLENENPRWWTRDELQYDYRASFLKRHPNEFVVLRAEFELTRDDPAACVARMNQYTEHRRKTQPTEPSVGSMFKNPPGDYAGRLIEAAGLKGKRVGNVQVSVVHANFFVNLGGGTARELLELVELVRGTVRENFKVELELEIQLVGVNE
ncbi:MAG: UDP-N-acetylmuramate dehydrogenase [Anaerolineales bacterium]|nr:UDP-N-acetylmuramate dehydrogenase [Anaerolineales bacterium]